MSFPTLIAGMAQAFSWPHDFWRRMGWREFRVWVRALHDLRVAEQEAAERARAEQESKQEAARVFERLRGGAR